jgi:hypothetical protein
LNITIHNQYPNLELISPIYYSNGTTCYVFPSQQTDTGNTIGASFGIDFRQKDFKCALLYKMKRKHTERAGNQSDSNTAFIEDTATNMHFLVVCNLGITRRNFYACPIEFTNVLLWMKIDYGHYIINIVMYYMLVIDLM